MSDAYMRLTAAARFHMSVYLCGYNCIVFFILHAYPAWNQRKKYLNTIVFNVVSRN